MGTTESKFSQSIKLKQGDLIYLKDFLNKDEADQFFEHFKNHSKWVQDEIKIFGKTHPLPRLTAWYGNQNCLYRYSGIKNEAQTWTPHLLDLRNRILKVLPTANFNSVLLNYYRSGGDKVGWHSDNEKELGQNPIIASVSLGASRKFQLKHRVDRHLKKELELSSGSLLIMMGELQHFWKHQVPAQKKVTDARINLTFRNLIC